MVEVADAFCKPRRQKTRDIVDQKGLDMLAMGLRGPAVSLAEVSDRPTLSPRAPIGASLRRAFPEKSIPRLQIER